MAKTPKNITIKATPGRNERVDPVVRLEDLLGRLATSPARAAPRRGAAPAEGAGDLVDARQALGDLAARLRALRGTKPGPRRGPAGPARKA